MVTPGSRLIALRRLAVDRGSVLAVLVTVLVVAALVSGVVASLPALQQSSLRAAVQTLPAEQTIVELSAPYSAVDATEQDRAVRALLAPVVEASGGTIARVVETVAYREVRSERPRSFLAVTGEDVLTAHSGRLPAESDAAVEVAVRAGTPGAPPVGSRTTMVSPFDDSRVDVVVVGSWSPARGAGRALAGVSRSSLLVSHAAFDGLAARASSVRWRVAPALDGLRPDRLDELSVAALGVDGAAAQAAESFGTSIRVSNPLPDMLSARSRELTTQRMLLLAPALVLLLLGAAGALLVAGALAEVRGSDEALLRSRGAGFRQMVGPTAVEAAAVCVLAAAAAPVVATAVVRVGGVRPPLEPTAWLGAGAAALVCWIALVLPVVLTTLGGDRGEQLSVERRRRRALTALLAGVLLMVALGVVAVVRLRGFAGAVVEVSRRSGTVDPLMVAGPALLLLSLVTVLALVLLPVIFRVTEWALRARGVALAVGTRSATRAPARTVPFALAVALAAGGVTFATVEHASQESAREARAIYEVGADVRVSAPPSSRRLGVDRERDALTALEGVREVSGVRRELEFVDDVAAEVLVADLGESAGSDLVASAEDPGHLLDLLQAASAESGAAPAAVTRDLAERAALRVGDLIQLTPGGTSVTLEVVGVLAIMPTISEGRGGVLVGSEPLGGVLTSGAGAPGEWWLAVDGAVVDEVATQVRRRPALAQRVLTRADAESRLALDPGTGGAALAGVMTLTALGALLVGVVFLGTVLVLRRRDRGRQVAVLTALGATDRSVTATLATEYAVTTAAGLVTGAVAGLVTAAVALDATALSTGGVPLVPAPELRVPWRQTAFLLGLLLVAPLAALLGLGSLGGRRSGAATEDRWRP